MATTLDILEERVAAAAALIASLRSQAAALERELETTRAAAASRPPPSRGGDPLILAELERLRAERGVVRERVRGLLREIDRVSW